MVQRAFIAGGGSHDFNQKVTDIDGVSLLRVKCPSGTVFNSITYSDVSYPIGRRIGCISVKTCKEADAYEDGPFCKINTQDMSMSSCTAHCDYRALSYC